MQIDNNEALYLLGPYNLKIINNPINKKLDKNEVLIKIMYASICETDLKIYRGKITKINFPRIMGHEAVAEVIETGENVTHIKEGNLVLIDPNIYDGTCKLCRESKFNLCLNGGLLGREKDGVLQRYMILQEKNLYPLPSFINIKSAPLLQPLSTVIHSQKFLSIKPYDFVLIIGMGVTGLMHTRVAKEKGAITICASRVEEKIELTKKFGGDYFINISNENFENDIGKITEEEGVDVLIDTSSNVNIIYKMLKHLKPGGSFLSFGITEETGRIPMYEMYFKEAKIYFSRSSLPVDFLDAIKFAKNNRINLNFLINKEIEINEVENALKNFEGNYRYIVNLNTS